jgi:hypothetical protein
LSGLLQRVSCTAKHIHIYIHIHIHIHIHTYKHTHTHTHTHTHIQTTSTNITTNHHNHKAIYTQTCPSSMSIQKQHFTQSINYSTHSFLPAQPAIDQHHAKCKASKPGHHIPRLNLAYISIDPSRLRASIVACATSSVIHT